MSQQQNKNHSIKRKLVNNISAVISVILFTIFLTVDLSVDTWVEDQFNQSLTNKANYLKTLVEDDNNVVEFDFAGEFMSEYEAADATEFYQLWHGRDVFERSDSLELYENANLPFLEMPINESKIIDYELPNGRDGRALISHFVAQKDDRNPTHSAVFNTMTLAIAAPTAELNKVLIIIDVVFILTCVLGVFGVRYLVTRIVNKGLHPLHNLNDQIKLLDITGVAQTIESDFKVEEIEPIRNELNKFITVNQQLYSNEKRLTSDIAHELKTPIAELISLSEVAIRYPDDRRISDTYTSDVLNISQRMKTIVSNLLLLQRSSSSAMQLNAQNIILNNLVNQIVDELTFKHPTIKARLNNEITDEFTLNADEFSLNTILCNLIDNALFYGLPEAPIKLTAVNNSTNMTISVSNKVNKPLSSEQLTAIFDPLYQLDSSRTNNQRHGLGLSIVQSLCNLNGFTITASNTESNTLTFILTLPLK
ncbi:HAMP domain-containing histidine kinase [Pseudoalteromonas sp. NZS127_1]|uniref:sensor histidine kinase n=1 Tax=unclassified Pseudoalteromonas TaxID=194690 RepID=UPI0013FE1F1A|nr:MULTISPECIES: HAMP domain-containing sensor histidine kinase [unclassified Pseudoalteromonas]MBG9994855.1 HAMP domain-containing histidine kinase [Pseudoalteromonas sp. NZS127_1]MBH0011742.1 HAMP domain-containing histidine kinase [Pseudoalteromonas sp. NZS100_1]MBH0042216.1 HAMP domain-containing histidine kinase [Pseudoalteromonas sp. SWXJZ10B]MBH0075801.1 HAMP domain-containing histidine kinase [Pseudoalteromonas sp. SWYJ118]